jgi:hypothetical protein
MHIYPQLMMTKEEKTKGWGKKEKNPHVCNAPQAFDQIKILLLLFIFAPIFF